VLGSCTHGWPFSHAYHEVAALRTANRAQPKQPDNYLTLTRVRGSILASGQIFLLTETSSPALRPTQPPIRRIPALLYLRVKRSGRDVDHLHHFRSYERVELYLYFPIRLRSVERDNVTFCTGITVARLLDEQQRNFSSSPSKVKSSQRSEWIWSPI